MAEEKSQFASEQVELSELERIQQRLNTFTVGLKPANAEVVNQVMQKGLSAGNFQLNDLDALVSVREDVAKGLIDWNTQVTVANKRIQELQVEELQAARDLVAKNLADKDLLIDAERQAKKSAELEKRIVEEENKILKAKLEALSSIENNVTSKPIQDLLDESRSAAEHAASQGKKSKAWDMIRASRPEEEEESGYIPQSETSYTMPATDQERFEDKVAETKKAFKDFEEESKIIPTPALEDSVQFRPKGTTTESFLDEVDRVNEVAEADELLSDEPVGYDRPSYDDPVGFEDESFDEDEDFDDSEDFYNGVSPFEVTADDEDTQPNFTKPIISGGNAPNIQAQVNEPENITAPVEEEKKTIPTFDTEEDLLDSIAQREEPEEDYEEITIPSRSELESMSKAEVQTEADNLGFEVSGNKQVMIDQFEEQTEAFIASLQEDGDFISASETDNTREDEEKKDGDDDVRDGGYF